MTEAPVTTQIAKFMKDLEAKWDAHLAALLVRGDVAAALENVVAGASIRHLPMGTGATGRPEMERFYTERFCPHLPGELTRTRISRTVDRFRLVDEATVSFVHDRELPWLLPGIAATQHRAEVLAITVVDFNRGQIEALRTLWDLATLTAQLGSGPPSVPSTDGPGRRTSGAVAAK